MATPRWEIMAKSGPEDTLQPVQLSTNSSSQLTAGNDWAVGRVAPAKPLFYTDEAEAQRFTTQLESGGAASKVLRDLASARHVCAQPSYALELCKRSFREHQLKQCSPAYVEVLKCTVKMARAVDILCRAPFEKVTACLDGAGGSAAKCVSEVTAFDRCTEDF